MIGLIKLKQPISISFFLHPNRSDNLDSIYNAYKDYKIVDEVLIVTGTDVKLKTDNTKFKLVHMPGPYTYGAWPSFGLLARYTFALSCKNKFVFMQDDDCYYNEETLKKLLELNQPLAGTKATPRWFYKNEYRYKPPIKKHPFADILITRGIMVDTTFLPDIIKYAKSFWPTNYQNVFNGEDIFLSIAMGQITGKKEFPYIKDQYHELPIHNVQLDKQINKEGSRTEICKSIYKFFEGNNKCLTINY